MLSAMSEPYQSEDNTTFQLRRDRGMASNHLLTPHNVRYHFDHPMHGREEQRAILSDLLLTVQLDDLSLDFLSTGPTVTSAGIGVGASPSQTITRPAASTGVGLGSTSAAIRRAVSTSTITRPSASTGVGTGS